MLLLLLLLLGIGQIKMPFTHLLLAAVRSLLLAQAGHTRACSLGM
jgi:hypothetical protein